MNEITADFPNSLTMPFSNVELMLMIKRFTLKSILNSGVLDSYPIDDLAIIRLSKLLHTTPQNAESELNKFKDFIYSKVNAYLMGIRSNTPSNEHHNPSDDDFYTVAQNLCKEGLQISWVTVKTINNLKRITVMGERYFKEG